MEYQEISIGNLLSQSTGELCRKTLLRLKTTLVSKTIIDNRGWAPTQKIRQNFSSLSRAIFRSEPFCVPESFWYRKNIWIRPGGKDGVSRFSIGSLLSHSTKKLRRGTFSVSKNLWYRKTSWIRGGRMEFHEFTPKKVFSLSTEKPRNGILLCLRKFLESKNSLNKRMVGKDGVAKFSAETSSSHSPE